MNTNQDKNTWVDRYLQGELNAEEIQVFQEALQQDAELREMLALTEVIQQGAKSYAWKETFKNWDEEDEKTKKRFFVLANQQKWLAFAAAVVLLLALAWGVFSPFNSSDPQELFASYYAPYPTSSVSRLGRRGDSSVDLTNQKEQGLLAYKNGKTDEAIDIFQLYLQNDSLDEDIRFFLGLSLLEEEQASAALPILNQLIEERSSYHHQAQWYAALGYLQQEDFVQATTLLEKISSGNRAKTPEAQKLLKEIRRLQD